MQSLCVERSSEYHLLLGFGAPFPSLAVALSTGRGAPLWNHIRMKIYFAGNTGKKTTQFIINKREKMLVSYFSLTTDEQSFDAKQVWDAYLAVREKEKK